MEEDGKEEKKEEEDNEPPPIGILFKFTRQEMEGKLINMVRLKLSQK